METPEQPKRPGWRERRREAKRIKAEREGDTPEKLAEHGRGAGPTAKDNAAQASLGATVNGMPQ